MIYYKFGKNAKNNHELIKNADENDWWVHLKDDSSPHVIIEKDNITDKDLKFVCNKIYNKNKFNPKKFIYTQIKNLKIGKKNGHAVIKNKSDLKYYLL